MRVELPRGQWAEFRDITDLKGGDAKAIRRATKLKVQDGALTEISMGLGDDQMDALLTRIIIDWGVQAANGTPLRVPMLDNTALDEMPLDTYGELCQAAQPYRDAIDKTGKAPALTSGNASTATSSPASPAPPILQGSAESIPTPSDAPSNGAGSPNDGSGPQPSPMSSPLSS